ncbi:hypothetical protein JFL43_16850 [Viridibacillus sp. YIM B01967]|uniref:Uncharacterized protein n=1 Tax=Viridibacillus soli TaxID=2798301 RepID=A0ABS1HAR9_9BACL|nr:hypothetical protein [Viridibacillus soli]MBK3496496.1 hypothetical protein [Viridibacillus soli]
MMRFNTLFVLILIAIGLRWLILDKFELEQLLTAFLLPVGTVVLYLIVRRQVKKEMNYVPKNELQSWSSYLGQWSVLTPKKIYNGSTYTGEFKRYYEKRWHRIIAELVEEKELWYLSLDFTFAENTYKMHWMRNSVKKMHESWKIEKNGQMIGNVKTNVNAKNMMTLKESMTATIGDEKFDWQSYTVGGKVEILHNGQKIGSSGRGEFFKADVTVDIQHTYANWEEFLVAMTLLYRSYYQK